MKTVLIIFVLVSSCYSKVYNGTCPKIRQNVSSVCDKGIAYFFDFEAIGLVDASPLTLNLFHNPFGSMKCFKIGVDCNNNKNKGKQFITMSIGCRNDEKLHVCYPVRTLKAMNDTKGYHLQFDLMKGTQCDKNDMKSEFFIIYNDNFEHMILYGCWEIDENRSEQGAWVLASKELSTSVSIDTFKAHAENALAEINDRLISDMKFFTNDSETCLCENCDYFMKCDIQKPKESVGKSSSICGKCELKLFSYILLARILYVMTC